MPLGPSGSEASSSSSGVSAKHQKPLPGSVQYVNWTEPSNKIGRPLKLDKFNRVIYAIPANVRTVAYEDAVVVVPRIGVAMSKVTAQFRQSVPDDILTIADMMRTVVVACERHNEPLINIACLSECVVCNGQSSTDSTDEIVHKCAICRLCMHSHCCKMLRDDACFQKWRLLDGAALDKHIISRCKLPPWLEVAQHTLCDLCNFIVVV